MVLNRLFVYGTLRSEFNNRYARLLRTHGELIGTAEVAGAIYRVADYPAYRPDADGRVRGELWRLTDPEATLRALDEYEGDEFERIVVQENGMEDAWIYRFRTQPAEQSRIASGDFCRP